MSHGQPYLPRAGTNERSVVGEMLRDPHSKYWEKYRNFVFEGRTHEAAARAAGCSAPVVGYVIREAQRYAREKADH